MSLVKKYRNCPPQCRKNCKSPLDLLSTNQKQSSFLVVYHKICTEQPSRGVLRKSCSENMQQIYRRTPMPKCDFNKVSNFIEIALPHGCSPVNLLHVFRRAFSRNTSGRPFLLLGHHFFLLFVTNQSSRKNLYKMDLIQIFVATTKATFLKSHFAWVLSCKFAAYLQNTFFQDISGRLLLKKLLYQCFINSHQQILTLN